MLTVYERLYDDTPPIVRADQVSKPLHTTPQGELPLAPGLSCGVYNGYERHGVCNHFGAVESLRGWCDMAGLKLSIMIRRCLDRHMADIEAAACLPRRHAATMATD